MSDQAPGLVTAKDTIMNFIDAHEIFRTRQKMDPAFGPVTQKIIDRKNRFFGLFVIYLTVGIKNRSQKAKLAFGHVLIKIKRNGMDEHVRLKGI